MSLFGALHVSPPPLPLIMDMMMKLPWKTSTSKFASDSASAAPIKVYAGASHSLTPEQLASLDFGQGQTALALAFVSPHLDFEKTVSQLRRSMPFAQRLVVLMTAGELSSCGASMYHEAPAQGHWDNVVVQTYSQALMAQLHIATIPLPCDDIQRGEVRLSEEERVTQIKRELDKVRVPFSIQCHDTLALTFFDGLSGCESFFMQAIYAHGGFPCYFVGGSAGGTLNFDKAFVFDGEKVAARCAVAIFIKLAPAYQYSIFMHHNFRKTGTSFVIGDADVNTRDVRTVVVQQQGKTRSIPFVEALCEHFGCTSSALEKHLEGYSFAVEIGGETYNRSVAAFDFEQGAARFFCDLRFGERLHLVQSDSFGQALDKAYADFARARPKALVGILANDCILRRLNNAQSLKGVKPFADTVIAGYSSFGELLGVHMNQTLTAILFYRRDDTVRDPLIELFPHHYSNFREYFMESRMHSLEQVIDLQSILINYMTEYKDMASTMMSGFESVQSYTSSVTDVLNDIQQRFDQIHHDVRLQAEGRERLREGVSRLQKNADEIISVLGVISSIADKTNLLALNASIEAARAGEHGRGFAVVADEVRTLSRSTHESVGETNETVSGVSSSILDIRDSMNQASDFIDTMSEQVTQLGSDMTQMIAESEATRSTVDQSIEQAQALNQYLDEINRAVDEINTLKSNF
ncbi:hypothetical protein BFW38_10570 [Terasakiispira papahanaumokuakeensis]|uniref:Methyl-accepting transducer domain-containing protein n=1 Tax=Terasakiispira papahanaumokuakeensis TaxID=197479 RepID=A0A1E2VAQ4_9GAMM|nr:methyl-accepting chemotaxis protein [Terasakiispira papahanaumokuakeensis]ODC03916.1 hypothetical protein BFW38_10570 [Terasakiispira papahanaumokuakeensis]